MRLIKAHITGYGRLLDSKINLDSKVVAIVGPNEAGKTTLLESLAYLNSSQPLPLTSRSRAGSIEDRTTVVTATFILDDDDRDLLSDLDLAQPPTRFTVSRQAGGGSVRVSMTPYPRKAPGPLQKAQSRLARFARSREAARLSKVQAANTPDEDGQSTLQERLVAIASHLEEIIANEDESTDEPFVQELADIIDVLALVAPESDAIKQLQASKDWLDRAAPEPEARARLWRRTPDFLLFEDQDRTLNSAYTLSAELATRPPASLKNLARLAELDLQALWQTFESDDRGSRSTLLWNANRRLDEQFRSAWNQSKLTVFLDIDGPTLHIMIKENDETITVFDERSAGLRMFSALFSFVAAKGSSVPPILLIDEAETHLHFDAQADLVNTFLAQNQADKIIYTTHSPACLPPDLGTGIRAVLPSADHPQVSEIHNSFWNKSAGYSPLMLAMGAGAAAFTPSRFVVLAEGPSEMILLPTLLRMATKLDSLGYQVAPGLSEAPKRLYPELDLEAARVAYLVDGDAGGQNLKASLQAGGVPPALIVELGAETLENLLDPRTYATAVLELLQEMHAQDAFPDLPDFGALTSSWSRGLDDWEKQYAIKVPSKVAVANRIVETGSAKLSSAGRTALLKLHRRLSKVLRIEQRPNPS